MMKREENAAIKAKANPKSDRPESRNLYQRLTHLNGLHPLIEAVPESAVLYEVVELAKGHVAYFNYDLAKEMGLIPASHSATMNPQLHQQLIDTFSLQILNEYDELHQRRTQRLKRKPNRYMATRYLQCQHKSKTGKTSGDGRGIWNGIVSHKGKIWDVSSRGTGVTRLSPGFVELGKPLKTGNRQVGYGCGMADIDELVSSAVQAEIFHNDGLNTERVLCVIDLGDGFGIGVRASQNLLRPAHMFLYLKQGRTAELKRILNYAIERQIQNGKLAPLPTKAQALLPKGKYSKNSKYAAFLHGFAKNMAQFAAYLEENYIFVWMDWDGDNLLLDPGIIDYGSVRQFGSCHNEYRYDDVQKYSTSLKEQKAKAHLIVRVMAQLVDSAITQSKAPLADYRHHWSVQVFLKEFRRAQKQYFLERIGANSDHKKLSSLEPLFRKLENWKIGSKLLDVADGVDNPPVLNMNRFVHLKRRAPLEPVKIKEVLTSFGREARLSQKMVKEFKKLDLALSQLIRGKNKSEFHNIHFSGNALIESVEVMIASRSKYEDLTQKINYLISEGSGKPTQTPPTTKKSRSFMDKVLKLKHEFEDDI